MGSASVTNCFSTGSINAQYAGGIAGYRFGYNATNTCAITSCYSTGSISSSNAGGIVGADVGYNDNASYTPVVNITNSYSLGTIATTCGGICGGMDASGSYTNTPSITITNCYSYGTIVDANSGIVSTSYPKTTTQTNTYAAQGAWNNTTANANLTGSPTDITTSNPGSTWTMVVSGTPYVLSLYNAQLYSPNSASSSSNYTSGAGLFQSEYTYQIVYRTQSTNELTTRVFVSKGTAPYYNSYNFNTFTFTNLGGTSSQLLSTITSSTGVLLNVIPLTISADGATQSVQLRMLSGVMQYSTDNQVTWNNIVFSTNWPVIITNSNPGAGTILRVAATQDLTISSTYGNTLGYFIAGSSYVTFDGSGNTININSITSYPGFIQNGTSTTNGFANVVVQNINVVSTGSTLDVGAGWVCQSYFGNAVSASVTNCFSTGTITAQYAGGIVGYRFGYNATNTCAITSCYSIGAISGSNAGGIVGADVGFNDNASYTPVVNITNSYSLGAIATTCGGICGGTDGIGSYVNTPSITITNCYSAGTIVDANSGIVSTSYPKTTTQTNTYAAQGAWNVTAANTNLTGAPTNFNTPGSSWTMVNPANPYVLSLYNAQLYSPNSASGITMYTSAGSVFGSASGYTYIIININQVANVATTKVFAYKGTITSPYAYNYNTFTLTDTPGVSFPGKMSSSIASTTGVLTITKSANNISADGSENSINLRMSGLSLQYSVVGTAPVDWTTISAWPMTLTNSNPGPSSVLRVVATQALSISSSTGTTNGFFIAGSPYITFDGSGNTITISGISSYPGLIQNGSTTAGSNGFANVVVQNFTTAMSGSTLPTSGGWLCQQYFGRNVLGNAITNCTNSSSGLISVDSVGGIAGRYAGSFGGSLTITSCTNNGTISGNNAGGIVGANNGFGSGSVIFIGCTNNATISSFNAGGIAGNGAASTGGSATFTNCTNSGLISGQQAGGISAGYAGFTNGSATFTNCSNSGLISGQQAGGIVGYRFGCNTSNTCAISGCYSTSSISGSNAGGIVGADVGFNDNVAYTPVVNITNSYSLGTIATTCGGICGGWISTTYINKANILISNCYSYGALTGTGAGLVGATLTSANITLTTPNTYVAAGRWLHANANANLTGTPNNFNTPGSTWTMVDPIYPYVLSLYNAAIYTSSDVSGITTYTSAGSVFGSTSGYTYEIININQVANVVTTKVFAYKDSAPYYNSYNYNTFTFTDLSGVSVPGKMSSSIGSTTGVLTITKSENNISADGSGNSIYLQMSGVDLQYSVVGNDPVDWTTITTWPITLTNSNSNPEPSSVLRVVATQALSISSSTGGTNGFFIAGSPYITFEGSGNTITISDITSYPGLIQNGSTGTGTNGFANIVVQNFTTAISGSSTLSTGGGWLCQQYFGRNVSANAITGCTNSITGVISTIYAGGIAGQYAGSYGGSLTFTSCANTGIIGVSSAGGIAGKYAGAYGGSATFTSCTNNGDINEQQAGGIAGNFAGSYGSATFTGCTNTGAISGSQTGGIAGPSAGSNGSVTFTGCTNTGSMSGSQTGGIAGNFAGSYGSATFTGCTNTGDISGGMGNGGIAGYFAGYTNGSVMFTNCANTGTINSSYSGGIVGASAGDMNGLVTITNCFSTGNITTDNAGGIAGSFFASNTSRNCVISGSYSTGNISGSNAGGIVGASIGKGSYASYTGSVDISNCYSLGTIATTCGGICGGWNGSSYTTKPNIRISNCYSYGALTETDSGLVAVSLTSTYINLTTTNTYVAGFVGGTNWTDASANDSLSGTPTSIALSSGGTTWTSISANVPYLLTSFFSITNPTQIYTPNNVSSLSYTYRSSPGAYSPGIYSILSTSQPSDSTIIANVTAVAGTSPTYYGYYNNIFTWTSLTGSGTIAASINPESGVLDFNLPEPPYPCFLEGSKILCFENDQEVYRPIENLRKGDLVKTIYNGYMPIHMIGTTTIYNPGNDYRVANRLYKCSKEKYPTLFEDLYITGCHSILVPWMTDDQWENTKAVNGDVFVTDNHFRLVACADEKAEPFNKDGFVNIYHVALEHCDIFMNYGIYANGLLVESCSERNLRELSNMRILGEEDCSVSENDANVPFNITRQLVEIY